MNLRERLMDDLKDALRAHDETRKAAIRAARAVIQNREIELQAEASDAQVQEEIGREVKRRAEALEMFRQAGRDDLVPEEEAQLAILKSYLPEQLSRDEIEAVVRDIVAEMGAAGPQQLGPVMREAMSRLKGKADGRLVNEVVREMLQHA
jgi:uncharacterized protein YqeY